MLTLTVRHSGSLRSDLRRIRKGWERLRAWLAAQGIRRLAFVSTIEITRGRDGLGHVHMHVVIWLPFVDYRALGAEWRRAIRDPHAAQIEVTTPTGNTASAAALYIATYATKGADADELGRELAGEWYCAAYGRRLVTASTGFWQPWRKCPGCSALEPPWLPLALELPDDVVCWVGPTVPDSVWDELRPRPPPDVGQVGLNDIELVVERLIQGRVWRRDGSRRRWRSIVEPDDAPMRDI